MTARRLKRVRQRMGAYRHDLLVAMRVVNKIEREMVQSEWESWLAGENRRCEQVRELLASEGSNGKGKREQEGGAQSVLLGQRGGGDDGSGEGKRRAALREWFDGYCTSCAVEQRAVAEQMGVGF